MMRLLFVKDSLVWPRSSGHDVHTFYMMKACVALGHEVSLATVNAPSEHALDGVHLEAQYRLHRTTGVNGIALDKTWLQKRFRSFWGVSDTRVTELHHVVTRCKPDAVVIVGLDALPYFPVVSGAVRVWYTADEWVLHHLSQLQLGDANFKGNLWGAAVKGVYERAYSGVVDRAWVVSDADKRAMRWVAGIDNVDVLPNGVDGEYFTPGHEPRQERTAVFWGRLDFGPNIQGLEWFCRKVWPLVRAKVPDARFTVIGFQPGDEVRRLTGAEGISLLADVRDLRATARSHAVAVLPFVSGAGIKNKLLEAAAMGMPIVCTPSATRGLRGANLPLDVASTPQSFADNVVRLWSDQARQRTQGAAARCWVLEHHTWTATARDAMQAIQSSIDERRHERQ